MQVIARSVADRIRAALRAGALSVDEARVIAEHESRTAERPGLDEVDAAGIAGTPVASDQWVTEDEWVAVAKQLATGELTDTQAANALRLVAAGHAPTGPSVSINDAMALAARIKSGEITHEEARRLLDDLGKEA